MGYTAIFGGTFNPFHIGHYEILSALEKDDDVDEIFLMPDKIPPHKSCDFLADDKIRIEMCKLAAEDFPKAKLCLIEFERDGRSYTFDTITLLKEKYPDKDFAFVMGGDMLSTFDLWYRYEELIKMIDFIAFKRVDTDIEIFKSKAEYLINKGMKLKIKDELITNTASSAIRKDFSSAKKYLPKKIFEFLIERGIYSE